MVSRAMEAVLSAPQNGDVRDVSGATGSTTVAAARHHSSGREGVEGETYDAPRRQKPPPPGTRPASLAEPRGDVVQVQRHTVEHLADGVALYAYARCSCAADGRPGGGHLEDHCQALACSCGAGYRRAQDHPGHHPAALGAFGASAAGGTAGGSASALV